MPCLIALISLLAPRIVIVLMVVFTDYIGAAYKGILWPMLGFLFMPFTTLAYAYAKNANGSVEGFYLAMVVVAVLLDFGTLGGAKSKKGNSYFSKRL